MVTSTAHVRGEQRFTQGRRCPICNGADRDPRGKGRRCHGFVSADGEYAHCSREEHAGGLLITDGDTYGHKIGGPCKCGTVHRDDPSDWKEIEAAYDYRDERGTLLYQVVRLIPKSFRQRRPDGNGGWEWKTAGMRRVLYRLPELLKAPLDAFVFVVEGEKDVDTIRAAGGVATCNPMGAEKWSQSEECARVALADRHIVIIIDADEVGRKHGEEVASALADVAATVRVLELPKKDATEWMDAGGTLDELQAIAEGVEVRSSRDVDPWKRELEKALAEVQVALNRSGTKQRVPMFYSARDLFSREYPRTPWLVDGLITSGGTAVCGGEPKAIKTWLACEMAVAIVTGTQVFGKYFAQRGAVAYFYAEDLDKQVRNRLRALLASRGLTDSALGDNYQCSPRGKFFDVLDDADLAWIVASARRCGKLDLLVLDPLRDIHSGEEDKSDSMRDVMRRLRLLGELLGCTVLVVHHTAKQSESTAKRRPGQRLRGSGAIHGSIDAGIYLSDAPGGDGSTVFVNNVVTEVKGARAAGVFGLELRIEDDSQGEALAASWVVVDVEKAQANGSDLDAKDDQRVFERVRDLEIKGEQPLSRNGLRDAVPGVADKRVRAALARLIPSRLAIRDVEHQGRTLKDRVVLANAWAHTPGGQ